MKIQRAFKVRLYPTETQRIFLNKILGCRRFLYNPMAAERIAIYKPLKDKTVIGADKGFGSSKTCHICGYICRQF